MIICYITYAYTDIRLNNQWLYAILLMLILILDYIIDDYMQNNWLTRW